MPGLGTTMTLRELALAQGIDKNDPIVEMLSKSTPLIEDMGVPKKREASYNFSKEVNKLEKMEN